MDDLVNIQKVFPGAELMPAEPSKRMCLLRDVRVATVNHDQIAGLYTVDSGGFEQNIDEPLDTAPAMGQHYRTYQCVNCGYSCDGSDGFEIMRQHLGKRNNFISPFGESL